jgi:hypothetical protein
MKTTSQTKVAGLDCLFLSVVIFLSLILYVRELGFYSDDWAFLATMSLSPDQSLAGLFKSLFYVHDSSMRPVQFAYLATVYKLFNTVPLGYHMVNACVILSTTILFYLVMRELDFPRLVSLSVPLVYALLPHYSSTRFWFAASHICLSMTFYFLSLFANLKALRSQQTRFWGWILLSQVSLLGSAFTYELAIPLFFLNLIIVWYRGRILYKSRPGDHFDKKNLILAINLPVLIMVLVFKLQSTERLFLPNENKTDLLTHIFTIIKRSFSLTKYDYGLNIKQAILVNFGDYGIGLPLVVWSILSDLPDFTILSVGFLTCLIIFVYLYYTTSNTDIKLLSVANMLTTSALGLIAFGLGYAIYITNNNLFLKIIGIHNRYNLAATAGLSLSFVAGIGLVSTLLPIKYWRKRFFCALISILCTFGFIIINTTSLFWITAYHKEQKILNAIRQNVPTIPANTTLILDGICPYFWPGIVFDSSWDLAGALQLYYEDSTLRADVVTPWLEVKGNGIYTSLNEPETSYSYDKMFVYDCRRNIKIQLKNAGVAKEYFSTSKMYHRNSWDLNCPHRRIRGVDVPVF